MASAAAQAFGSADAWLKRHVRKGVPVNLRAAVWCRLFDSSAAAAACASSDNGSGGGALVGGAGLPRSPRARL